MRIHLVSSVLATILSLTLAAYVPGHQHLTRDDDICENVEEIVSLIKQRHATPFCSSFLGITPQTVTITTKTKTKTTVETSLETVTTTSSTTWTTFPSTTTTRDVPVGLSTTFLRTTTVPLTETTTVTTPGTATLTVTSYYTPDPIIKNRAPPAAFNIAPRDGNIPGYLKAYPTPSISQACSCLSIPAPTITKNTIYTTTTTSTTTRRKTSTYTQSIEIRPISRTTIFYTQIVPGELTVHDTTTTETSTTTTPPYATTTTVNLPFPTECINIGSGGKLYDTLIQGPQLYNMIGYDIDATPGEELRSLCCNDCFRKQDCMYWRVVATTFCRLYSRIEPSADPDTVTDQCPFGSGSEILQDPITDPLPDNPGFGKGPCL